MDSASGDVLNDILDREHSKEEWYPPLGRSCGEVYLWRSVLKKDVAERLYWEAITARDIGISLTEGMSVIYMEIQEELQALVHPRRR